MNDKRDHLLNHDLMYLSIQCVSLLIKKLLANVNSISCVASVYSRPRLQVIEWKSSEGSVRRRRLRR